MKRHEMFDSFLLQLNHEFRNYDCWGDVKNIEYLAIYSPTFCTSIYYDWISNICLLPYVWSTTLINTDKYEFNYFVDDLWFWYVTYWTLVRFLIRIFVKLYICTSYAENEAPEHDCLEAYHCVHMHLKAKKEFNKLDDYTSETVDYTREQTVKRNKREIRKLEKEYIEGDYRFTQRITTFFMFRYDWV